MSSPHYVHESDRVLLDDTAGMAVARRCHVGELPSFEPGGPREYIYFDPACTRVGIVMARCGVRRRSLTLRPSAASCYRWSACRRRSTTPAGFGPRIAFRQQFTGRVGVPPQRYRAAFRATELSPAKA